MNIEKIKEIAANALKRYDLKLHSLRKKREFGMSIIEITVDGEGLDAANLSHVAEAVNEAIDEYLPENYYLEVSTLGAIRVLNSIAEVTKQIGKYIEVTKDNKSFKGILEKVENDIMFIKVNVKGKMKVKQAAFAEADKVKLTVKY